MAEITADMVKQLRERTGQAMMDCKKALAETNGDMEKAVDLLRKKGMAVMEKRGSRDTKEGKVVGKVRGDGQAAVLATLCSETDFTSKNSDFVKAAEALANGLLAASAAPATSEAAAELKTDGGKKIGGVVNEIVSKTGEKITVGPFARFDLSGPGLLYCYVHFNGKIGTLVQLEAENDQAAKSDVVKTLASDLAMHVTAVNPVAVSRDQIDPALVAREKDVAAAQVVGKPANMIDKIVEGKLNKWYQQVALLEQPFVKDDSKTVTQLLGEVSKQAGGKISVKRFARVQIG
jgi:elongation factor Ts